MRNATWPLLKRKPFVSAIHSRPSMAGPGWAKASTAMNMLSRPWQPGAISQRRAIPFRTVPTTRSHRLNRFAVPRPRRLSATTGTPLRGWPGPGPIERHARQRTTPAMWRELSPARSAPGARAPRCGPLDVSRPRRPSATTGTALRGWPGPGPVVRHVHQRTTPGMRRELPGQVCARSACASVWRGLACLGRAGHRPRPERQ